MTRADWHKRRWWIAGGGGTALAVAVLLIYALQHAGGDDAVYYNKLGPTAQAAAGRAGAPIKSQPVETVQRRATLRLTGSLEADEESDVGSNAAGLVSETRVDRGSRVKKGDVMVQLDPRDAQFALDEGEVRVEELRVRLGLDESKEFVVDKVPEVEAAKVSMELAERNHRRAVGLARQNAIATADADQMEMEYRSAVQRYHLARQVAKQLHQNYRLAQTQLVIRRKALDDTSIRAPFDGWVKSREIAVGERVIAMFPGAKLVALVRIDPLRLSLTVPQQEMARVKAGQKVLFRADAFPEQTFTATVRYITPAVASDNRALVVEAVVPNPDAKLLPGLFVTAELELDGRRTDIFVPRAAVASRGDVAAVFVVRKGVIREQIVSLGETKGQSVQITSGLAPDDVVITTPEGVHDGDPL